MGVGAHQILDKAFEANEAMPIYRFVKLVTAEDRDVDLCDSQGELAIGVVQAEVTADDATNSRFVNVRMMGASVVEANGSLTKFAEVTTDAAGKAELAATGDRVLGIALDDASADTDLIAVLLTPAGRVV